MCSGSNELISSWVCVSERVLRCWIYFEETKNETDHIGQNIFKAQVAYVGISGAVAFFVPHARNSSADGQCRCWQGAN
jgi:hypothetical protein